MPHRTKIVFAALVALLLGFFTLKLRSKTGTSQTKSHSDASASISGQPTIEVIYASPTPSDAAAAPAKKFVDVILGDNADFSVELATTQDEITQGLSGRTTLSSDGMLFVVKPPQKVSFWMRSMRFPLDMIWIRNGKIIGIENNVPIPAAGILPENIPTYTPPSAVDYVLEIPGGVTKQLGITSGMSFTTR